MFTKNLKRNRELHSKVRQDGLRANAENVKFEHPKEITNSKIPEFEPYTKQNLSIYTLVEVNEFMRDREVMSLGSIVEGIKRNGAKELRERSKWVFAGVIKRKPGEVENTSEKCYRMVVTDLYGGDVVVLINLKTIDMVDKYDPGYILFISKPTITFSGKSKPVVFLTVNNQSQLMVVGKSKDAGYCESPRKITHLCDLHLAGAYKVARRKRGMFLESTTPSILEPERNKKKRVENQQIPFSSFKK
ncbi:hypothetical protein BB558_003351 [Smittium angustum]|uniref:Zinc finger Mcm10/DnaG-type domain-containing protein n=1 Tax=Smittium angustum TaxID=133377 RepID=A0A2U1J6K3_SMIAN|nr:hypothetical protein BB558_003351 [Smittium angustum]